MKMAVRLSGGLTLIEVLVTVLILTVGLLGGAALQARVQKAESESYQRSQAILLLNDMANRLAANPNAAANYVTGTSSPLGTGYSCNSLGNAQLHQRDRREWCEALQGTAETLNGTNVGVVAGGRGCIVAMGGNQYLVSVAWQGLTPVATNDNNGCGAGAYDFGTECTGGRCRRMVSTIVRVTAL